MSNELRASRLGKIRWSLLLVAPVALLGFAACGSMAKPKVQRRVSELPSNQPLLGSLAQSQSLSLDLGKGPRDYEVHWLHLPADEGREEQAPLVLIHGTPGTLFTWSSILDPRLGLVGTRPIYALEVIGHGFARGTARPYSFRSCGNYIAAWMRAIGLSKVDLVGHSYGGEMCLNVALDHPELVQRLVLADSSGIQRKPEEFLPEEVKMREMSLARFGYLLSSQERVEFALQPHFKESVSADFLAEITLSCESAENWRCMVGLVRDENGTRQADLPDLRQPTLLLWGENDLAYPPARFGQAFADALPDAQLVLLKDTGHYPFEEQPAQALSALLGFLNEPVSDNSAIDNEEDS